MVDEPGLDEPKVDETAVDKIAVDEPGPHLTFIAKLMTPIASSLICANICQIK